MPKAVAYTRVSTKEQAQNLSLSTQETECVKYIHRNEHEVDRVFVEAGESAKTTQRTQFQKLITYCLNPKNKIKLVVVYSISRIARNTHDYHTIKALLNSRGIDLRSVTESIDDSSTGRLMESMVASFAQFDNDVRSERTIAGMKGAIIGAGRWPFPVPLGFRKTLDGQGHSTIEPDPLTARLMTDAFELYATGSYQREQVLKIVTAGGLRTKRGKKLTSQSFSAYLKNPIYAGILCVPKWKIEVRGSFVPLVTEDTFQRVQLVLAGRRPVVSPHLRIHPDFPLRPFVKCARCGVPLTASWNKGRSGKKYPNYRCKNKCISIRKEKLEANFEDFLIQLQPRAEYLRLFREIVIDAWKQRKNNARTVTETVSRNIEKLKQRMDRLNDAFLDERSIDQETYNERLQHLRDEIALAERSLNEAKLEELDVEVVVDYATSVLMGASSFWRESSANQKQRFQRILFPEGVRFDGESCGTDVTCLAFNHLPISFANNTSLASRTGVEPVSPP